MEFGCNDLFVAGHQHVGNDVDGVGGGVGDDNAGLSVEHEFGELGAGEVELVCVPFDAEVGRAIGEVFGGLDDFGGDGGDA